MKSADKITLEEASLEILEEIRIRTEVEFSEKWQGKTEMVFNLVLPIVLLKGFDLEEKLTGKYKNFTPSISEKYADIIVQVNSLIKEATKAFQAQGLEPRQAQAESKIQVFQFIAREIPSNLAIDIIQMINS